MLNLDTLITHAQTWQTKLQKKAVELRFKRAQMFLCKAHQEIIALVPDGEAIPNQALNVRRDIKLALRELQLYRHHLGLVNDEQLSGEIKKAVRATVAA